MWYTRNFLVRQWNQLRWAGKELREDIEKWNAKKISQRNLPIKALSGGSNRPARHTKVASGRG